MSRACRASRIFAHAFVILLLLAGWLRADDAYPIGRRGGLPNNTWFNAGVEGGHRRLVTTIYTNITDLAISVANLNAAINNCPSNQVVKLAAGTFTGLGSSAITLGKNGVVLRGSTNAQGHPTTILQNAGIKHWGPWYVTDSWGSVATLTITAGLTEGSTSITVSSPPTAQFAPGDIFYIDQTFDGTTVTDDTQGDVYTRNTRPYGQALYIVSTNATTITFDPPLLGTYWDTAARSPQAVGWSTLKGHTVQYVGIEDLDFPDGCQQEIYMLRLGPAYQSWVYNVRAKLASCSGGGTIRWHMSVKCATTACTFRDTTDDGSGTYALLYGPSTYCRWENNIATNLSLFLPCHSSVGDSTSFNYSTGPYPYSVSTWSVEQAFPHGGHSHHTCYEGNHIVNIDVDDVFSNNNSELGVVRNRLMGWSSGKTGNTIAVAMGDGDGGTGNHRNCTIIGNVLGENSYHTTYGQIYRIEAAVTGTIRTNNFNTVDDAVPSSEGIGSNTMLDSYVYGSKPEWFGDRPWPPFGPTTAYTNVLGYTNIPAGYRSHFGEWPPPGAAQGGGGGTDHRPFNKPSQPASGGRRR